MNGVPPLVLVPGEVDEPDVIEQWLTEMRAETVITATGAEAPSVPPADEDSEDEQMGQDAAPERPDGRRRDNPRCQWARNEWARNARRKLEGVVGRQRPAPARAQRQPEVRRLEPGPPPRTATGRKESVAGDGL